MSASSAPDQFAHEVVLAKAVELCGGLDNLAYVLERPTEELCKWITGAEAVPAEVMREALILVSAIRK